MLCNNFVIKYENENNLVLVANPPRATTSEFLSHLSWQPSSLFLTALNLQYWEEERTKTPTSSLAGSSPEIMIELVGISQSISYKMAQLD